LFEEILGLEISDDVAHSISLLLQMGFEGIFMERIKGDGILEFGEDFAIHAQKVGHLVGHSLFQLADHHHYPYFLSRYLHSQI
jgi:hypothetical protein